MDTHDEEEYHQVPSGFGSYCRNCTPSPSIKKKEDNGALPNQGKPCNLELTLEKFSVFLPEKHRKYLRHLAIARGIKMKQVLYDIIEREMRGNPIENLL